MPFTMHLSSHQPCTHTHIHTHTHTHTQGSGCLGADTLLAMLKNYCRNKDIKTAITVGIVGLPNVGKSSLINSLKRSRSAQVSPLKGCRRPALRRKPR